MNDTEVEASMARLADIARGHAPELDGSITSLRWLEDHFADLQGSVGTQALGAYLGQTIIALSAGRVHWASFETAAALSGSIQSLGRDEQTEAMLRLRNTRSFWFPHVKLAKFANNGSTDSIHAFAGVVLEMAAPSNEPPEPAEEDLTPEHFGEALCAAVESFVAAPSLETLQHFAEQTTTRKERYPAFCRRYGLSAELFFPFLSAPATGRGLARFDPGGTAGYQIERLLQAGVEPEAPCLERLRSLVTDDDKVTRGHAARALARQLYFKDLTSSEALELAKGGDAVVRQAVLSALESELYYQRDAIEADAAFDASRFEPLVLLGLEGKAALREAALDVVSSLVYYAGAHSLLPHVVFGLSATKPAVQEKTARIFYHQALQVYREREPFTEALEQAIPRLIELTLPKQGAKKQTRVQEAAELALNAYLKLDEHLGADTVAKVQQALAHARQISYR